MHRKCEEFNLRFRLPFLSLSVIAAAQTSMSDEGKGQFSANIGFDTSTLTHTHTRAPSSFPFRIVARRIEMTQQ